MRQSSVRGNGPRRRRPDAKDLGWDDSLYEEDEENGAADRTGNARNPQGAPNPRNAAAPEIGRAHV